MIDEFSDPGPRGIHVCNFEKRRTDHTVMNRQFNGCLFTMESKHHENLLSGTVEAQRGNAAQPFKMVAIREPLGQLLQRRVFDFVGKRVEKHADESCEMKHVGGSTTETLHMTTWQSEFLRKAHGHGALLLRIYEKQKEFTMLSWAVTFLVIALIAGILGFGGLAGTATGIAHTLFTLFLILFLVSLVLGRRAPRV